MQMVPIPPDDPSVDDPSANVDAEVDGADPSANADCSADAEAEGPSAVVDAEVHPKRELDCRCWRIGVFVFILAPGVRLLLHLVVP